ncbi:MAG: cadherin repeat domain-containing protein, partial [Opitutales bacterium]|nr:cadherin repeat domain-containing protein [Opitutales bacterium]
PYKLDNSNSLTVGRLVSTDADGDSSFAFQILEGNLDLDGDGNQIFNLTPETGELQINDLEDAEMMKKEIATLSVQITDPGGLSDETTIYVNFSGQSILHTISENVGDGWFDSSWLGSFYGNTPSNWIFHRQLGWVYSAYAQSQSAWLFSEHLGWLWTSKQLQSNQWGHFIYSQEKNSWLLVKNWNNYTFFLDYSTGNWITRHGVEMGTWYEHPVLGLFFINNYAHKNGIAGQSLTHPELGLILSTEELEKKSNLHPFKIIGQNSWVVLESDSNGGTVIYNSRNTINATPAQVWSILQKSTLDNLSNRQIIESLKYHDWISSEIKRHLTARLIFNLPI